MPTQLIAGALLKTVLAILALGIGGALIAAVLYSQFVGPLCAQRPAGFFGIGPTLVFVGARWAKQAIDSLQVSINGEA